MSNAILDTSGNDVNPPVDPSIDECTGWVADKVKCGDIPESSGRLGVTAIKALGAMITADEPKTATFLNKEVDMLQSRWQRRNTDAKADTAHAYVTRAKAMLELFLAWHADPASFHFKEARSRRAPGAAVAAKKTVKSAPKAKPLSEPEPVAAPVPSAAPAPPPTQPGVNAHRFKLGTERYVKLEIPDGFTQAEWKRLVAHTLTLCDDFDPDQAPQVPAFAMTMTRRD